MGLRPVSRAARQEERSWMKVRRFIALVAVAGLLAACSSSSPSAAAGNGTIDATVQEWHIDLSSHTVQAGEVKFSVDNNGEETHEFVVVRTDLAEDALPVVDDQIPEDSDQLTAIDEVEDIESGSTGNELTVNLEPGHYVIFCNLLAHYGKGMHASLTVE
jgi:uncharacterized cupredoxin-like copper-binding protein